MAPWRFCLAWRRNTYENMAPYKNPTFLPPQLRAVVLVRCVPVGAWRQSSSFVWYKNMCHTVDQNLSGWWWWWWWWWVTARLMSPDRGCGTCQLRCVQLTVLYSSGDRRRHFPCFLVPFWKTSDFHPYNIRHKNGEPTLLVKDLLSITEFTSGAPYLKSLNPRHPRKYERLFDPTRGMIDVVLLFSVLLIVKLKLLFVIFVFGNLY